MSCDNPESLGRLIYHTAQEIKNFAERMLKPYELTFEQFHLLKLLSLDSGMSQREMGELSSKTPGNVTRILDRLESKKLVLRRSSEQDRRTTFVFLTDQGNSLKADVFATFETFSTELTKGISNKDMESARKALRKIGENIEHMTLQVQS